MPYIKQERRNWLTQKVPETLGELNWAITTLCVEWLKDHKVSYENYNNVIGVLECAKLEMYSKAVRPYEDVKCTENGEVYPE